jgi:hypothetical protein
MGCRSLSSIGPGRLMFLPHASVAAARSTCIFRPRMVVRLGRP